MKNIWLLSLIMFLCLNNMNGGNPDRQGASGAGELLMNPWARSAGLHSISTSLVRGIESTRINIAGLARIEGSTEIVLSHARYLVGTGLTNNALGLVQKVGKKGYLGLDIMTIGFGDIKVTKVSTPEGDGSYYSPTWANLALSYATIFDKVSVGLSVRFIIESTADIRATGVSLDGGVQYMNGPKDNFKLGLALRNVGTPMKFNGEGLTSLKPNPNPNVVFNLGYDQRTALYELPTQLNIGTSYDFYFGDGDDFRVTPVVNFTSNSFSKDQLGVGVELSILEEKFQVRGAYKADLQVKDSNIPDDVYTGLSLGASAGLTLNKETNSRVYLDYSYLTTRVFEGTHNFGLRVSF